MYNHYNYHQREYFVTIWIHFWSVVPLFKTSTTDPIFGNLAIHSQTKPSSAIERVHGTLVELRLFCIVAKNTVFGGARTHIWISHNWANICCVVGKRECVCIRFWYRINCITVYTGLRHTKTQEGHSLLVHMNWWISSFPLGINLPHSPWLNVAGCARGAHWLYTSIWFDIPNTLTHMR